MTQEEKQILLKDLCARLPYGVIYHRNDGANIELREVDIKNGTLNYTDNIVVRDCKPYLRPMFSMTEEELNECVRQSGIKDIECPNWQDIPKEKQFEARLNHSIAVLLTDSNNVDWLNSYHFDYRGLIERGLALEAPKDMYK